MSDIVEKLKKEEEELEKLHYGNREEPEDKPQEPQEEAPTDQGLSEDPHVEMEEIILSKDPESDSEPEPKRKKYTDWKKRYTNFKPKADSTIHSLRVEVSDLKDRIANLESENFHLRSKAEKVGSDDDDFFNGVFTDEDRDTLGDDGLNAIKKASRAVVDKQVKPLQEKLRQAELERIDAMKRDSYNSKRSNYDVFLQNLGNLVPDYEELNVNPNFLEWMKLPDEFSGVPRSDLFVKAEASGDVARVAGFFAEFKRIGKGKSTNPQSEEIEDYITPKGSGVATSQPKNTNAQPNYIRESEINEFYADLGKGRYKGRDSEVKGIEAQIDRAYKEGLILRGQ